MGAQCMYAQLRARSERYLLTAALLLSSMSRFAQRGPGMRRIPHILTDYVPTGAWCRSVEGLFENSAGCGK